MKRYPFLVLFVLSPWSAELLFGATPISNLGALLPVIPLYGGGAVLIRELARRRGPGWGRIALLGIAFAIVEEGLAIQSLSNPVLFGAADYGGRALGINWVWTTWTLGFHTVWSICVPILLAELVVPARRTEPWLERMGVIVVGVLYALGAVAVGAIFRLFVTPGYRAPVSLLAAAALVVAGLVAVALGWPAAPRSTRREAAQTAPPAWWVGVMAAVFAASWFALLNLPQAWRPGLRALAPLLAALVLVGIVIGLLGSWSAAAGWYDLHRLALVWGALGVVMVVGFFRITAGSPIDQAGQGVLSLITILLLAIFTGRVVRRVPPLRP